LPVADGKHVLIADEPQSFADACVRLLDDCSPAKRMSDAAYSLVEDQFATKRVTASLAAVLRYVTSNRGQ
jgi:glycosyltransferase involved in cell wall biosynthesis